MRFAARSQTAPTVTPTDWKDMRKPVYEPWHYYYVMHYDKDFANGFGRSVVLDLKRMGIVKYYRTISTSDQTTHYFVRADYDLDTDDSEL